MRSTDSHEREITEAVGEGAKNLVAAIGLPLSM
jgi:hypothetical protein